MKLIYVLFFCVSLLMLFINLNYPRIISKKIAIGFWMMFALIVVLHLGIIEADFILPPRAMQIPITALVFIVFAHYIAEQQKESTNESKVLDDGTKSLRIKMISIFFQRIVYVLALLLILMSLAS